MAVIGNQQIFNAYLVWAEKTANLVFFGKKMPTTWLITVDSILSVSCLAGAVVFWRLWSKKFREPAEITKLGIGSLLSVTGFLSLAAGAIVAANSGGSVDRLAHHLPLPQQHRVRQHLPCFARTLHARRAARLVRHHHRHLLPGFLRGQQSRRLGSAAFSKKCPRLSSGSCTLRWREPRASSSSPPAISSAISSRLERTDRVRHLVTDFLSLAIPSPGVLPFGAIKNVQRLTATTISVA